MYSSKNKLIFCAEEGKFWTYSDKILLKIDIIFQQNLWFTQNCNYVLLENMEV